MVNPVAFPQAARGRGQALADEIRNGNEYDWDRFRFCGQRLQDGGSSGDDQVRLARHQFLRERSYPRGITGAEPVVDADICPSREPRLVELLLEQPRAQLWPQGRSRRLWSTPIRRIPLVFCACAAIGHTAPIPPRSVMNSRRCRCPL